MWNGKDILSLKHLGNQNKLSPMTETCSLSTKTNINSETSQKREVYPQKTSSDPITFKDAINKQIKLMQNSVDEYDKFLKLFDKLITRIDLTMDSTRLTVIKKTVCFTEHNKVFLIPPRETPPRNNLTIPFLDPFYWKMPPTRTSCSYPTAFSSDKSFQFSSTTTDIWHVYLLLAGHDMPRTTMRLLFSFDKWSFDKKKKQNNDDSKI